METREEQLKREIAELKSKIPPPKKLSEKDQKELSELIAKVNKKVRYSPEEEKEVDESVNSLAKELKKIEEEFDSYPLEKQKEILEARLHFYEREKAFMDNQDWIVQHKL